MGLSEEVWTFWERQAASKRPSTQSTREAIYFYVHVCKQDLTNLWPNCWQLANYLDYCKQKDKEQSQRGPVPASSNVSQVPWACMELERLGEKARQIRFGQRTPPFQTQQDAHHYYRTMISAADPLHITIKDLASRFDTAPSAITTFLFTGEPPPVSSANLGTFTFTITMPDKTVEPSPKVMLGYNDPNHRAYKRLPQQVRQEFRPPGGKWPTANQAGVYLFVLCLGGPPGRKGEDKIWWESTAAPEWNKTHPDRPLQPDSLRREYQDAERALRERNNNLTY